MVKMTLGVWWQHYFVVQWQKYFWFRRWHGKILPHHPQNVLPWPPSPKNFVTLPLKTLPSTPPKFGTSPPQLFFANSPKIFCHAAPQTIFATPPPNIFCHLIPQILLPSSKVFCHASSKKILPPHQKKNCHPTHRFLSLPPIFCHSIPQNFFLSPLATLLPFFNTTVCPWPQFQHLYVTFLHLEMHQNKLKHLCTALLKPLR